MKKFEWDFSSLNKETRDRIGVEDKDSVYWFNIPIDAGYYWGSGWPSEGASMLYDYEMENALREEFPKNNIKKKDSDDNYIEIDAMGCGVYVHPMEWTGFATKENLDKLLSALEKMDCVKSIDKAGIRTELLYPINIIEYQKLIADNYPKLKEWFEDYDKENNRMPVKYREMDIGIDFAKENRLPIRNGFDKITGTLDNHKGYGSLQEDCHMITCLYRAYQAEKNYELQKNIQKDDFER